MTIQGVNTQSRRLLQAITLAAFENDYKNAVLAELAITNPNDSFLITITAVTSVTNGNVKVYYTIASNSPQVTPSALETTLTQSSTTTDINNRLITNGGSQYANVVLSVPTVIMVTNAPSATPTTALPTYSPTGSAQPTTATPPTPSQAPSLSSGPTVAATNYFINGPTFSPTVVAGTTPGSSSSNNNNSAGPNIPLIVGLVGGLLLVPLIGVGGYLIHQKIQVEKKKKQDQVAASQYDIDEDERRRRIVWSNQTNTEDDEGDGLGKVGKSSLMDLTPSTTTMDMTAESQPVTPYLTSYPLGKLKRVHTYDISLI